MIERKDLNYFKALVRKLEDATFPIKLREGGALYELNRWSLEFQDKLEHLVKELEKPKPIAAKKKAKKVAK